MTEKVSEFVERFGLMWERLGSNRSVGRVMAWLLVADPAEQTAGDIADALKISQANVSTTVRTLEMLGLVERISIPGKRRIHFRIPKGAWQNTTGSRLREFDDFMAAASLGREVMAERTSGRERIEELWEWASWWRARYGELVDEWEEHIRSKYGAA